jgi:ABC-type methionine transport system permease subunit
MVNRLGASAGQAAVEFIILLIFLTAIGYFIVTNMVGTQSSPGAVEALRQNGTHKIANDNN